MKGKRVNAVVPECWPLKSWSVLNIQVCVKTTAREKDLISEAIGAGHVSGKSYTTKQSKYYEWKAFKIDLPSHCKSKFHYPIFLWPSQSQTLPCAAAGFLNLHLLGFLGDLWIYKQVVISPKPPVCAEQYYLAHHLLKSMIKKNKAYITCWGLVFFLFLFFSLNRRFRYSLLQTCSNTSKAFIAHMDSVKAAEIYRGYKWSLLYPYRKGLTFQRSTRSGYVVGTVY